MQEEAWFVQMLHDSYWLKTTLVLRVGFQPAKSLAARTADKFSHIGLLLFPSSILSRNIHSCRQLQCGTIKSSTMHYRSLIFETKKLVVNAPCSMKPSMKFSQYQIEDLIGEGTHKPIFLVLKPLSKFIVLSCFGEDLSNLPLKRRINKLFKPQTSPCYKNILFAVKFHGPVDVATQKRAISV